MMKMIEIKSKDIEKNMLYFYEDRQKEAAKIAKDKNISAVQEFASVELFHSFAMAFALTGSKPQMEKDLDKSHAAMTQEFFLAIQKFYGDDAIKPAKGAMNTLPDIYVNHGMGTAKTMKTCTLEQAALMVSVEMTHTATIMSILLGNTGLPNPLNSALSAASKILFSNVVEMKNGGHKPFNMEIKAGKNDGSDFEDFIESTFKDISEAILERLKKEDGASAGEIQAILRGACLPIHLLAGAILPPKMCEHYQKALGVLLTALCKDFDEAQDKVNKVTH